MSINISAILAKSLSVSNEASPIQIPCNVEMEELLDSVQEEDIKIEIRDTMEIANTLTVIGDTLVNNSENDIMVGTLDVAVESLLNDLDVDGYDTTSLESRVECLRKMSHALECDVNKRLLSGV